MFKFLKQIFSKAGSQAVQPRVSLPAPVASSRYHPEGAGAVEVASLSLRSILEKLPHDLRAIVNQLPEASVKVVLPVNAIMKQLPTGTVKMSLASLYRQAPSGTFRKTEIEEKRMVEVPLGEIFKSINPARLKRRNDQRHYEVPEEITGLFGESNTSRTLNQPAPAPAAPSSIGQSKPLRMSAIEPAPSPLAIQVDNKNGSALPAHKEPAEASQASLKLDGKLYLTLFEISAAWPEGIRGELSVLPGDTKVVLPVSEVSAGLQKGKVTFTWGQFRGYLPASSSGEINIPEDTLLLLPLKIVAPAFVAATGAKKRSSAKAAVNKDLPDFFGPAAGCTDATPATHPTGIVEEPKETAAAAAPLPVVSASSPLADQPRVAVVAAASTVTQNSESKNLGELFNDPGKTNWNPNELVKLTCGLPGVIGAIVALEEGLVVAQKLPEGIEGDTFAAFMPQIFSRLDKYTGEMQLGETLDIAVVTSKGPCRFFRKGKVFFAILGKTGVTLPIGLHLIAEELANQNA